MTNKSDITNKIDETKIKITSFINNLNIKIPYMQNRFRRIYDSNGLFFYGIILGLYLIPILFSAKIYFGVALIPALLIFPIYLGVLYFNFKIPLALAFNNIDSHIDEGKVKFNINLLIIIYQFLQMLFTPRLFNFSKILDENIIHLINKDFLIFIIPRFKEIFIIAIMAIIILFAISLLFKRELNSIEKLKYFSLYFLPVWIIINYLTINLLDFIKTIIVGKIMGLF